MRKTALPEIISRDLDFIINSNINWERFRNRTVLITGAYGMLLSYMTYTFLRLNQLDSSYNISVILLIRDIKKATNRFKYFLPTNNLAFYTHTLQSPIKISSDIHYIIHGASYASPHIFNKTPSDVITPNVFGTYYLLELAKSNPIQSFLYFSSGAVYGKAVIGEVVTENDYGYLDPLDVTSCYAESKRIAENMCKCWHSQFDVPAKIVRPAHIYGPSMDIESDTRVFANFVKNVLLNQDIVLQSDGSAKRSFCYIADSTVAYFKVLLDGSVGEAYNVSNDAAYISIRELAQIFVSTFPEKKLQVIIPMLDGHNSFCGKQSEKLFMDSSKLQSLGWKCSFSIHEGLKRTLESFQ
jgi:UDP-glucuronate decarboxylase